MFKGKNDITYLVYAYSQSIEEKKKSLSSSLYLTSQQYSNQFSRIIQKKNRASVARYIETSTDDG